MSALAKVRNRLAGARAALLRLRPEFKSRAYRGSIDEIVRRIEACMDFADERFADERATAAQTTWRDDPEEIERQRGLFELWAIGRGASVERGPDGGYTHDNVRFAWGGWLGRHTAPASSDDLAEVF